jgi:hypothetical protein
MRNWEVQIIKQQSNVELPNFILKSNLAQNNIVRSPNFFLLVHHDKVAQYYIWSYSANWWIKITYLLWALELQKMATGRNISYLW